MIPKQAIDKAVEGGWKDYQVLDTDRFASQIAQVVALDPTFWQALGKALGWHSMPMTCNHGNYFVGRDCSKCNAFRFYDLILTDADTLDLQYFWQELVK